MYVCVSQSESACMRFIGAANNSTTKKELLYYALFVCMELWSSSLVDFYHNLNNAPENLHFLQH